MSWVLPAATVFAVLDGLGAARAPVNAEVLAWAQRTEELILATTGLSDVVADPGTTWAPTSAWIGTGRRSTASTLITCTLSIPGAPRGSVLHFFQGGAGAINFVAGANTQINNRWGATRTSGLHADAGLVLTHYDGATAHWTLTGEVTV